MFQQLQCSTYPPNCGFQGNSLMPIISSFMFAPQKCAALPRGISHANVLELFQNTFPLVVFLNIRCTCTTNHMSFLLVTVEFRYDLRHFIKIIGDEKVHAIGCANSFCPDGIPGRPWPLPQGSLFLCRSHMQSVQGRRCTV